MIAYNAKTKKGYYVEECDEYISSIFPDAKYYIDYGEKSLFLIPTSDILCGCLDRYFVINGEFYLAILSQSTEFFKYLKEASEQNRLF